MATTGARTSGHAVFAADAGRNPEAGVDTTSSGPLEAAAARRVGDARGDVEQDVDVPVVDVGGQPPGDAGGERALADLAVEVDRVGAEVQHRAGLDGADAAPGADVLLRPCRLVPVEV